MRAFLILLSLALLSSCIQEIPINMPDNSNRLVVGSLIYPDKLISMNVSYVRLFSDSTEVNPKILEISIKENGVLIDYPKGQGPEIYSSTYPKEGSTYELTVTTDKETVTAKTSIPTKVLITKAESFRSAVTTADYENLTEAVITWSDPVGPNFYELQLDVWSFYQYAPIDDPVLQQEGDLDYYPSTFVFSDKLFEGKTYNMTLRFSGHSNTTVLLRNVSEEYYHFKKSWHRHIWLQNTSMNVDKIREDYNIFPLLFQGDPVPLSSNFNNNLGIFAGFNQDIRQLKKRR
ncbi:MAG: DUF4249 domain-containing protein [Bacteroidales bacterium]